jgi:hypothetical protein
METYNTNYGLITLYKNDVYIIFYSQLLAMLTIDVNQVIQRIKIFVDTIKLTSINNSGQD